MDAKSIFIIDRFVNTRMGEPYRLFPFGTITKNGRTIELTPELAAQFKLPHFKPAIKLGSHADETPAGGHIVGLEVRADGLYAIPEWNDNGTAVMDSGAYRYHSPEIVWEGEIEDSATGQRISAPIVWGDALLHGPALGEAAAFYHVEKDDGGNNMSEMTQVPTPLWDKFQMWFNRQVDREEEPTPAPEPQQTPDVSKFEAELQAKEAEVAEYKAKVEQMEAAANAAERIAKFGVEFKESPAVAEDHELHTLLAGLPEETAAKLVTKFKALSAQINETSLTGDVGANEGQPLDASGVVAVAQKYAAEHKITYTAAINKLAVERPELFDEVK